MSTAEQAVGAPGRAGPTGAAAGDGEARGGRTIRIAAVGDLHYNGSDRSHYTALIANVDRDADILVLCGDLTTHGTPEQAEGVAELLEPLDLPVVAVLGNHDWESGRSEDVTRILCDRGIHILDGDTVEIGDVGFAGVKGFAGGFDRGALAAFGEPLIKQFVQEALDEALKLENALRQLTTEVKIAVLHYAPLVDTVQGEPEIIYPFLGSSRLLSPIDTLRPDAVFHGHAHTGTLEATTPAGVPVFNVAHPLLHAEGRTHFVWTVGAAERRASGGRG